jgi:hypothetical protein
MAGLLEQQASKVILGQSGQEGTKGIFAVDDDKIVTSTDMKVGTYTIAAQPTAPCLLSVTVTAADTADTMGTIAFVGTDISGTAISETVTPVAGSTVYTTKEFASVTSATGAGWAIDEAEGSKDQIKIGVSSVIAPTGYYFSNIQVVAEAVVASQTAKSGFVVAELSDFTKLPVGIYPTKLTKIALTSGEAIGYLTRD